jgi:hypothetical protein
MGLLELLEEDRGLLELRLALFTFFFTHCGEARILRRKDDRFAYEGVLDLDRRMPII